MSVTFATICLNEAEYLERNIEQHIDLCDRWIFVEGACRGYPTDRVTDDGYSTDGTGAILADAAGNDSRIEVIRHGWTHADGEGAKSELRNRYAERCEPGIVIVIDADEFYRRDDLQVIIEGMRESDLHCWRVPQIHFWKSAKHIITGGYYNVEHNRVYRWVDALRYVRNHNHPEIQGRYWHECGPYRRSVRNLARHVDGSLSHNGPCVYHFGFAKSPENIADKNQYYVNRGEAKTRPETTECRQAWFAEQVPPQCRVHDWSGPLPEVFE